MSRKLFAFLLGELACIRIKCKRCNGVAEIPIGDIRTRCEGDVVGCKICKETYMNLVDEKPLQLKNPFDFLDEAFKRFKTFSPHFEIEFICPDKESAKDSSKT